MMNASKVLIALAVGFIIGLMFTCNRKGDADVVDSVKVVRDTIITVQTKVDTVTIDNPKVIYQREVVALTNTDTIIEKFRPSDYTYTYPKSIWANNGATRVDMLIQGWGNLEKLEYTITEHDTLKEYFTETTITKAKQPAGLFLSGSYSSNKQIGVGVDLVKNKLILGGQISVDPATSKAVYGARLGYRIK